ncbi:type II secretion system F family protein [Nocardioides sp. JQ2195]|uniref:type II secretion system F family protein n=1 Tax=Nocardioides sp. JQ2195 TaxID=2592334 RepID=UPI00143EABD9|nr:type II secretion system F family protein [Nocardioides sp. JQ2195]QIX28234.1 type II secretion system F family protein [Nocardioides sp. JQ2195]
MTAFVSAVLAAVALVLALRPRPVPQPSSVRRPSRTPDPPLVRHRVLISGSAALGGVTFLAPPVGWVVAAVAFAAVWVTIGRAEPAAVRREREQVARELPQVIQLIGLVLASGGSLADAIRQVAAAFPGPAVEPLRRAEARLAVGMAAADVWRELAVQPGLERVGRALCRAEGAGIPVASMVQGLGADLAREERARSEDAARTVGVRAAVPLGLCLLPAFLVIGIVPVIASALTSLQW